MSLAGLMVTVAVVAAAYTVFRFFGALLLGAIAWFLVGMMALSLVAGIEVPTSVVVAAIVFWVASQLHTRMRLGHFRSTVLSELEWRLLARRANPQTRLDTED
ncbi:MAG: hypothetical protein ABR540_14685 [Acidimicrobiales bacterium]